MRQRDYATSSVPTNKHTNTVSRGPAKKQEPPRFLVVRLPEELHRAIKALVAQEGTNLQAKIPQLVREYLRKKTGAPLPAGKGDPV